MNKAMLIKNEKHSNPSFNSKHNIYSPTTINAG